MIITVSILGFLGFIFGMTSTLRAPGRSKVTIIGTIFLLIEGFSLIANYLPNPFGGWLSIYNWNFGFPIIILASFYLAILAQKKEEINFEQKSTFFSMAGWIMVLCAFETAFFLFLFPSGRYFLIVSICTVAVALTAGILIFIKKFQVATALMILTFLLGISLSVSFLTIFSSPSPESLFIGLLYESPTILLSAIALVFAFLGRRNASNNQSQ